MDEPPFEFALTIHMMDQYVKPGDSVPDIGGGPGRYSPLVCVKRVRGHAGGTFFRQCGPGKGKSEGTGRFHHGAGKNRLELEELGLGEFDHVFLMGPLYHPTGEADRAAAVQNALWRVKKGGNLYCSFILDFAGILFDMKNGPGVFPIDLNNLNAVRLIDSVISGGGYSGPAFTNVFFINQRRIGPFMAQFEVEKLHLFGREGILASNEKQILTFPKEEQALRIGVAKRFLELPELLAFSEHAMFIGRK